MFKNFVLIIILSYCFSINSYSQSRPAHEIAVVFGPAALQSDYSQKTTLSSNLDRLGFGIGIAHFLNFSSNRNPLRETSYFKEHFKLQTSLSYTQFKLKHDSNYIDQNPEATNAKKLKAMYGSTRITNIGTQLVYQLKNIHDFENTVNSFAPYIGLGFFASKYNVASNSTLNIRDLNNAVYYKYLSPSDGRERGFTTEKKFTVSAAASIGTRYKLSAQQDLMLDVRFQYFNSDWIDGLNPNKNLHPENNNNDWLMWFNVGYIYYLQ